MSCLCHSHWPRLACTWQARCRTCWAGFVGAGAAEEQEGACTLGCPSPSAQLSTETLQHSRQAGWHWCAAAPGCCWSPAALGRCHARRTSCCATELYHLPAQAQPRTHGTGIDNDKPLACNCNSDRKKVTFIVYLSLGLAVLIIAVVSAIIATLPVAAQSVLISIVFSSNAPKPLKKTYSSECK